jgi:hypothetical protein
MFTPSPSRVLAAALAMLMCIVTAHALAQSPESTAHSAEGAEVEEEWVWVPGHRGADEAWILGFYREPERPAERWIDPHTDDYGLNVPGQWIPEAPQDGESYRWVRGHRADDAVWVQGFWRVEYAEGFEWVDGYYDDDDRWSSGHWRPALERAESVWVPGHVLGPQRLWRIGFWRPSMMNDFTWVDGYYGDGLWYGGYWSPSAGRSGYI